METVAVGRRCFTLSQEATQGVSFHIEIHLDVGYGSQNSRNTWGPFGFSIGKWLALPDQITRSVWKQTGSLAQNQPGCGRASTDAKLISPAESLQSCWGVSAVSSLPSTSDFFQYPLNPTPVPIASDNDELSIYGQWKYSLKPSFWMQYMFELFK